jgi:hypothetical protein
MIVATDTLNSEWAWAETASAPSDLAAVIQTDSEMMQEELKFLQEETVSIAIAHEQPISEAPSTIFFHDSSSQKRTVTCRSPELQKTGQEVVVTLSFPPKSVNENNIVLAPSKNALSRRF